MPEIQIFTNGKGNKISVIAAYVVVVDDLLYAVADSMIKEIDSVIIVFDSVNCQSNNVIIEFD